MTRKEAVAAILRDGLNDIIDQLNGIGLPSSKDDQWRVTLVMRNVDIDNATIVFGQDDEAALIVALKHIGASTGRREYRAGKDGIREVDPPRPLAPP